MLVRVNPDGTQPGRSGPDVSGPETRKRGGFATGRGTFDTRHHDGAHRLHTGASECQRARRERGARGQHVVDEDHRRRAAEPAIVLGHPERTLHLPFSRRAGRTALRRSVARPVQRMAKNGAPPQGSELLCEEFRLVEATPTLTPRRERDRDEGDVPRWRGDVPRDHPRERRGKRHPPAVLERRDEGPRHRPVSAEVTDGPQARRALRAPLDGDRPGVGARPAGDALSRLKLLHAHLADEWPWEPARGTAGGDDEIEDPGERHGRRIAPAASRMAR